MAFNRLILITALCSSLSVTAQDNSENKVMELKAGEDEVTTVQAATTNQTITTSEANIAEITPVKKAGKISGSLSSTFQTNTQEFNSKDDSLSNSYSLGLSYNINETYKVSGSLTYNKDLANSFEDTFSDTKITLSGKTFELAQNLSFRPSVTGVLPSSEVSRRGDKLQLGVEINPSVSYKISDSVSLAYNPRVVKNFHEFTTNEAGSNNTEYKLLQFLSLAYSYNEKISLSALVVHSSSWSYLGTERTPSFLTNLEIGYGLSKELSVALGTNVGGSLVDQEQGPDSNIEFYDENNSNYYASFAFIF